MQNIVYLLMIFTLSCSSGEDRSKPLPESRQPSGSKSKPSSSTSFEKQVNSADGVATYESKDADSECETNQQSICAIESAIIERINRWRQSVGLDKELTHFFSMSAVARLWSEEQVEKNILSHEGFPEQRQDSFRQLYPDELVPNLKGENLAKVYLVFDGGVIDAKAVAALVVDGWLNSSDHKDLLQSNNTWIGVGIAFENDKNAVATAILGQ